MSPVLPQFEALLRRKKIKHKDGNSKEEYMVDNKRMKALQKRGKLNDQELQYLKENQLKYHMLEYIPGEEDQDDDAKSIDSIESGDLTPHTRHGDAGPKEALAVRPFEAVGGAGGESTKNQLVNILRRAVTAQEDALKEEELVQEANIRTKVSIKDIMEGLKKKQWVYMRHLLAYLKHKERPIEYLEFPGFYDNLFEIIQIMNAESVDGLVDVYKLTTMCLQEHFPGVYASYSKFKEDYQEHVFQHPVGEGLFERYDPRKRDIQRWMRVEPQGEYVNESQVYSFQIPVNIAYGSQGSLDMLKSLEKCKTNEIFKLPAIQGYLNYKWDQSKQFLLVEAVLHGLLLVAFNVFATRKDARESAVLTYLVLAMCGVFVVREVLQVMGRKCTYFIDPFNYPDLGAIACCALSVLADDLSYEDDITMQWPIVIGLLLLYTRAVSYFRLWGRTRHLIRAITETFNDMIPFVLIMIVLVLAFGSAYVACFEKDELKNFSYDIRLFKGFELMLGGYEDPENGPHYFIFVVLMVVTLIVMLNMLIAIMGDTFGRVQANTIVYDYRERLSVNIDLESLIFVCARKKKILYHIGIQRRPGGFDMEEESFSEQNKLLRRLIKDNARRLDENQQLLRDLLRAR